MKITVFEGTPEEYKEIANVLGKTTNALSENKKGSISRKDAYRALLKRATIYDGQRDMYKVLAKGELPFSEYSKLMKRTPEQIRGVHGALGRRVNTTPEIHQAGLAGNIEGVVDWNRSGKNTIALKPEFLEVLKEEGLI
jgi:hypothetical protein